MTPLKNKHITKEPLHSIKHSNISTCLSFVCDQVSPSVRCLLFVEAAGCDGSDEIEKAKQNLVGFTKCPFLLYPSECLQSYVST